MAEFSPLSLDRLGTCQQDLIVLFIDVVENFDCSVLCGYRGEEAQTEAFDASQSKLDWPDSKHNTLPAMAIDVAPYPVNYDNIERFYFFAGYVLATAKKLKEGGRIKRDVRWGGDWDMDTEINDQFFNDLCHFELV